jgi:hypothetical protein
VTETELQEQINALVADRRDPDRSPTASHAAEMISLVLQDLEPEDPYEKGAVENQKIRWNPRTWREHLNPSYLAVIDTLELSTEESPGEPGWHRISRGDVFDCRTDPVALFIAAMVFGYGPKGNGATRTTWVLDAAGETGITDLVAAMQSAWEFGQIEDVWRTWSPPAPTKILHLDTAFASKVGYFSCYDRAQGAGPLIADANTAWAVWALVGEWDTRASAASYAAYVSTAERWAGVLGCRSDDIERALFALGKRIDQQ